MNKEWTKQDTDEAVMKYCDLKKSLRVNYDYLYHVKKYMANTDRDCLEELEYTEHMMHLYRMELEKLQANIPDEVWILCKLQYDG